VPRLLELDPPRAADQHQDVGRVASGRDDLHPRPPLHLEQVDDVDDHRPAAEVELDPGVAAEVEALEPVVPGGELDHRPRRGLEPPVAARRQAPDLGDKLELGNLDARRDWGYAKDYVEAMWLMLQHGTPEDFVIATGETNTVRRCVEIAFDEAGLEWEPYVRLDEALLRPAEVDLLVGDPSKAERLLGWTPRTDFETLIRLMVRSDLALLSK
jgi:hypothetical protein